MPRSTRTALLVGAAGAGLVIVFAIGAPRPALAAWLAAAIFVTAIPAGALALLLTAQLHNGQWAEITGEATARAAATLPAAAMLLAPPILLCGFLYHWAEPGGRQLAWWLEPETFIGRGAIYLALWWLLAHLCPAPGEPRRPGVGAVGLIVYAVTASFAGFDWVLSLQPDVYSSIFGLIFIGHQMLAGFSFAVLVSLTRHHIEPEALRGLGNMLFGGVMLWVYLEFMQYLVVWSGDLPDHTAYFLERSGGAWGLVIYAVAIAGGALPFVALLSRHVRGSAGWLSFLAGLFLFTRALEACWWVLPLYGPDWRIALAAPAAFAGATGLWLAVWLWAGGRKPRTAPSGIGGKARG